MTVNSNKSKTDPQVMGSSVTYDFDFNVLLLDPTEDEAKQAIKCVVSDGAAETELIYGTDYSVTLNDNSVGGTVTVTDPRTSDYTIIIYREYKNLQESKYENYNSFPASTVERDFDKCIMLCQNLQEQIERCVKVGMSSSVEPQILIDHVERIYSSIDNLDEIVNHLTAILTVEGDLENIDTVSGSIANVNVVANDISRIIGVYNDLANIDAVNANKSHIDIVAGINTQVSDLAAIKDKLNVLYTYLSNINTAADNISRINTTAGSIESVNAVAGSIASVNTAASNIAAINNVASIKSDVTDVAGIKNDVSAVSSIKANVTAVAGNATNINAVSGDLNNINAVAGDLQNIDAASTNAANARIAAEGTDVEAATIGLEHSSKGWATQAGQSVPDASENTKGKIAIATNAEAISGTDDTKALTPAKLKARSDSLGVVYFETITY